MSMLIAITAKSMGTGTGTSFVARGGALVT